MSERRHRREPGMTVGSRRLRLGAVVAVAVAAAIVVWLVTKGGGNSTPTTSTAATTTAVTPIAARAATPASLRELSTTLHQPIYWAGAKKGFTYELTETRAGNIYIRYLPPGVKVGDPRSSFLIVVTYPYRNAFAALHAVAKGNGKTIPRGGLAVPSAGYPKSVHLAFPGVDYQIEVYDPTPAVARAVAYSGDVRSVGS
jgi:hypothetical protein